MTDLNTLRASLNSGEHVFADTLAFIGAHYDYQPQSFINGGVENAAGQNEGSCKTLGLALLEFEPGAGPLIEAVKYLLDSHYSTGSQVVINGGRHLKNRMI